MFLGKRKSLIENDVVCLEFYWAFFNYAKVLEIDRTVRDMHGGSSIADEHCFIRHAVNTYEAYNVCSLTFGRFQTRVQAFTT